MHPPMPGTLKAARIILFALVGIGLVGLVSFFVLLGAAGMSLERVLAEIGMDTASFTAQLLMGTVILGLQLLAAIRMGAGGRRAQRLVRLALGLGVLGQLYNMLQGTGPTGLVITVLILVLVELAGSREWFEQTEPRAA